MAASMIEIESNGRIYRFPVGTPQEEIAKTIRASEGSDFDEAPRPNPIGPFMLGIISLLVLLTVGGYFALGKFGKSEPKPVEKSEIGELPEYAYTATPQPDLRKAIVTTQIRAEAKIDAQLISQFSQGAVAEIVGEQTIAGVTWARLRLPKDKSKYGWIIADNLAPLKSDKEENTNLSIEKPIIVQTVPTPNQTDNSNASSAVLTPQELDAAKNAENIKAIPRKLFGRCRLKILGRTYIDGKCNISIEQDGTFSIYKSFGDGAFFAQVNKDGNVGHAFWNGNKSSIRATESLGEVLQYGACWKNANVEVCAWKD